MALNPATLPTLVENINLLDNQDIDTVLSLLHTRKCDKDLNPDCAECSWKGSILCLPIRRYMDNKSKDEEVSE